MSIKSLRLKQGFSQEKLADLTGLSTRTIQRIEKENKASLESLNLLAIALDTSLDTIKQTLNNPSLSDNTPNEKIKKTWFVFILVNALLFLINMFDNPSYLWFLYPLFIWGGIKVYRLSLKNQREKSKVWDK